MPLKKAFVCLCLAGVITGCSTIDARSEKNAGNRFGSPYAATKISPTGLHGNKPAEALLLLPGINLIAAPFIFLGYGIDFVVALTTDTVLLPIDLIVMASASKTSLHNETATNPNSSSKER